MQPLLITTLAVLFATALPAQNRAHYWVDVANGSDTNAGTKLKPFKSIFKALGATTGNAVVHVMPGVYGPATTNDFWDTTTKAAAKFNLSRYTNFKLCGEDRDTCIIDFNGNTGVWYGYLDVGNGASDVEICNLTFKNLGTTPWGNSPININGDAKHVNIHDNYFLDCNSTFINWGGLDCAFHDNVIDSTKTKTGVAIRVRTHYWNTTSRDRMYVYNNLILNHGHGISYDGKTTSKQWIVNNTVLDSNIGFPGGTAPHTNAVIENNCAFGNTTAFGYTQSKTNLLVDPQLVDKAKKNFRLKSTSPCIEAGWVGRLEHEVNDYFGAARGYDWNNDGLARLDIGPHEMTDVSLSATTFEQGKVAEFSFGSTKTQIALGFFFISLGESGNATQPVYHLDPIGTIGIDLSLVLWRQLVALPTASNWKPVPAAIPTDSALNGLEVYVQGFAFTNVGGTDFWKPTGRLDLDL